MTQIAIKRLTGKFYAVTGQELVNLRKKLTGFEITVLLYLRGLNPFSDKFIVIDTADIAEKLRSTRRTIQRFLKKFKALGLIELQKNQIQYKTIPYSPEPEDCETERSEDLDNDPGISKTILRSPERSKDRQQQPEPPVDKDRGEPKTIKTIQIESEEKEKKAKENKVTSQQKKVEELQFIEDKEEEKQIKVTKPQEKVENSPPIEEKTEEKKTKIGKPKKKTPDPKFTEEIKEKMRELNINPEDRAIKKAVSEFHISQIWATLQHIEENQEVIRNPNVIFLIEVKKQPIDKRKSPKEKVSKEFKEWYGRAIAEGKVRNRPIETLGKDRYNEPVVETPDGHQWPWRDVQAGKAEIRKDKPFPSLSSFKEMVEKAKRKKES